MRCLTVDAACGTTTLKLEPNAETERKIGSGEHINTSRSASNMATHAFSCRATRKVYCMRKLHMRRYTVLSKTPCCVSEVVGAVFRVLATGQLATRNAVLLGRQPRISTRFLHVGTSKGVADMVSGVEGKPMGRPLVVAPGTCFKKCRTPRPTAAQARRVPATSLTRMLPFEAWDDAR